MNLLTVLVDPNIHEFWVAPGVKKGSGAQPLDPQVLVETEPGDPRAEPSAASDRCAQQGRPRHVFSQKEAPGPFCRCVFFFGGGKTTSGLEVKALGC